MKKDDGGEKRELSIGNIGLDDRCCRTCNHGWMKKNSDTKIICRHPHNQAASMEGFISRVYKLRDCCSLWEINSFLG